MPVPALEHNHRCRTDRAFTACRAVWMAGRSALDLTTAGASVRWFGAGSNAAIRGFDPKVRLHAIDYHGLYIDVGTALTGRVLPSRS
jgi:hypothetical protein